MTSQNELEVAVKSNFDLIGHDLLTAYSKNNVMIIIIGILYSFIATSCVAPRLSYAFYNVGHASATWL